MTLYYAIYVTGFTTYAAARYATLAAITAILVSMLMPLRQEYHYSANAARVGSLRLSVIMGMFMPLIYNGWLHAQPSPVVGVSLLLIPHRHICETYRHKTLSYCRRHGVRVILLALPRLIGILSPSGVASAPRVICRQTLILMAASASPSQYASRCCCHHAVTNILNNEVTHTLSTGPSWRWSCCHCQAFATVFCRHMAGPRQPHVTPPHAIGQPFVISLLTLAITLTREENAWLMPPSSLQCNTRQSLLVNIVTPIRYY